MPIEQALATHLTKAHCTKRIRLWVGWHTIWSNEAVGDYSDGHGGRIETIHLVRQTGLGSEILPIPVCDVGKVYLAIDRVDRNVVERVELPSVVVVDEHCGVVWRQRVHCVQSRSLFALAFTSEEDVAIIVCAAYDMISGVRVAWYLGKKGKKHKREEENGRRKERGRGGSPFGLRTVGLAST